MESSSIEFLSLVSLFELLLMIELLIGELLILGIGFGCVF